jgi:NADPH:quinone reductase
MRAAVVTEVGAPPIADELPEPVPREGQALVAVHAAALNPVEIRVAAGRHPRRPEPPYVPGLEGVGVVVASSRFAPGVRVRFEGDLPGWGAQGTLAECAAVPEGSLVELPAGAPDDLAAAAGVVGITALLALERAALRGGERVLVLAATGAVGQVAVQLAKVAGAGRVVAAARSRERLLRTRELGADETVLLDGRDDLEAAYETAAGGSLDVVVDPLWGEPAMAALRALAPEGRLVNVGQSAGTDVELPLAAVRNRQGAIHAISSGWTPLERKTESFRELLGHALAGRLVIDREVVPLAEVAEAWTRQADSPGRKLVIAMGHG